MATTKTTTARKPAAKKPATRKAAAPKPTLKDKVAAAEKRQAERSGPTLLDRAGDSAIEAKDQIAAFAKKHPVAAVAGGIAAGILLAGLFKGPRKAAVQSGTKLAGLAGVGAELALAYAAKAFDAAKEAGEDGFDWLEELGLGERARSLGADAADYASTARDTVVEGSRSALGAIRDRLN